MNTREPWIGLASVAGFAVMLLGHGLADIVGFLIALVPLAYGAACVVRQRRER